MIEEEARQDVVDTLSLTPSASDDWLTNMLTTTVMKWYHRGGVDALEQAIVRFNPKLPAEERP